MIATILTRLGAQCASFEGFGDEISLSRHLQKPPASPYAWVFPLSDSANPNRLASGRHSQRVTRTFGVLIYLAIDPADTSGGNSTSLEALRSEIQQALAGWEISATHDPIEYQGGDLADMTAGTLFWVDTYTVSHYLDVT